MGTTPGDRHHPVGITRRSALFGGTAMIGVLALSACSRDEAGTVDVGREAQPGARRSLELIPTFDTGPTFGVAGIPQRFPFQLATPDGAPTTTGPDVLEIQVRRDGAPVGAPVAVAKHQDQVPNAYYPLRFTPEEPGTYTAATRVGPDDLEQSFQVGPAGGGRLVQVGQPLVAVDTPTTDDHRGVEPICTRTPDACDLHGETLAAQLGTGRPVALLISTPRFCQIGICGPVLELLLAERATRPDLAMVHAEVYADAVATGNLTGATLAPTVEAFGLTYEPALFVAGTDGTVVERLDYVFDRTELRQALDKAAA